MTEVSCVCLPEALLLKGFGFLWDGQRAYGSWEAAGQDSRWQEEY